MDTPGLGKLAIGTIVLPLRNLDSHLKGWTDFAITESLDTTVA